tara:strand:+ start:685 stop:1758 length:1074 start_codon:yes stop_codon:yes gene_type:complete
MADRYWVLGTGTWSSTNTVNWSASSGGAGGASVPTSADNVFFDANSNVGTGAFTVTMANTPRVCRDFTASGLDGAMTLAGSGIGLTVSGSLTFQATNFTRTYTSTTIFNSTTTSTVTTNGVLLGQVTFNGIGGSWSLGSALTTGTANTITLTNGTLNLQSYTLSVGLFSSSNSNTRTINFGTGDISCTGFNTVWDTATNTGLTVTSTGTINFTNGLSKTLAGGGFSYDNVTINQGGAGSLFITGSNTFGNITNTRKSTSATSILFSAGTTNTFTNWNASGEATRLLTIGSSPAASHTLSKASGTVSADFLSISRSSATGGAGWYAGANSTDGGNNSGWIFTAPPAPSAGNGNFLMFF